MKHAAPSADPAIAVLPYGLKPGAGLAQRPLHDLRWPLGCPARLHGGTVGDLTRDDHLICYPSTAVWLARRPGLAKLSLMIVEPEALHKRHMRLARVLHRRLWRVLSCNAALLNAIPNGIFFPFGSTWVPEWRDLDLTKSAMLSLIASAKRDLAGHKLRHACADWLVQAGIVADIMGRGYRPFGAKAEGLAPYRYSIVIENVREPSYFTEKLIDALLCRTVPIYWGAPDIDRFFDPAGMIICETFADVQAAVARMSAEDYAARADAIALNQARAAEFADIDARAAHAIADTL